MYVDGHKAASDVCANSSINFSVTDTNSSRTSEAALWPSTYISPLSNSTPCIRKDRISFSSLMAVNIHITIIELNALHTKRQNLFQELDAVIHLLMEAKHWGLRKSRNATSLNSRFKSLRRITIPLTLSNLKLLRRITRTENILHRNFTRRQVAIQNRVASNIGISQSTFSVKVLNLFSRSRRKTNKRKSKHSAMLRNKETRHRMFIGLLNTTRKLA